ncbi:hypothetical protein SK128_002990 [Halocaridina rubra]|uniref:Nucleolar protein 11 n=1 Tax=Halocaridina rubra TaxID=373956 RepID=A0AAN8X6Q7_HALRR
MAARLLNTNFLCSDFSIRNLIGVTQDVQDHILVTCRGVVKQYNVHNQKQTQSWTTKTWHPFTAPAVCHPVSMKVVAVINKSSISQWTHEEDDIDKLKREHFETSIHQLLISGDSVYIVFTSGHVEELNSALKTRKEPKAGCLKDSDSILYAAVDKEEDLVILVIKDEENLTKIWKFHVSQNSSPSCSIITVKDRYLSGLCVNSGRLFTLWSDSRMHCLNLTSDPLDKVPGRHYASISAVDSTRNVDIVPVSASHLAIVGADTKDEGGILLLWDVKFAMVTSSRRCKMYHNPPMVWTSASGIVVVDGGSLSCTPYVIADSTLATVFGSRISQDATYEPEICFGWDASADVKKGEMDTPYTNKSKGLVEVLRKTNKISLSESMIVDTVIATLIEQKEVVLLYEAMKVFEDIPESCLITVLKFYIASDDSAFDGLFKYPPLPKEFKIEDEEEVLKCPFSPGKAYFINEVLLKPYTDVRLVKELQKLSFEDALALIQYLYFLLMTGEAVLCPRDDLEVLSLGEINEWLSFLLDTNYHQLVMSSQVTIHRLLLSCFTKISKLRTFVEEVIKLEPLIKRVVEEDNTQQQENMSNSTYSLERLTITR